MSQLGSRKRGQRIPTWLMIVCMMGAWTAMSVWTPTHAAEGDATGAVASETEAGHADAEGSHDEHGEAGHGENGHGEGGGHDNPAAPLFAAIVLLLFFAKVVGDLFERVGMPAVLGELTVGILLGNVAYLTGWHGLEFLHAPPEHVLGNPYSTGAELKILAEIGVVLLLFEVGLESNVRDMMNVGPSALLVAILGVVAPMLLGVGVGFWLLQDQPWQVALFIGATLCATSVGITARVLKDLGRSQQRESQIILGAAVIDDVLGLVVLTVVQGIILEGPNFNAMSLVWILVKSLGFLGVAIVLGAHITKPLFTAASYLRGHGLLVATSLVICFGMAYLANLVGLAPIVGAFAAGLILEHAHYHELGQKEQMELEEALAPLTALLVPIFFVQMGVNVQLASFTNPSVWALAIALTIAAVVGKQVCSLGVLEKGVNKLAIGLGMIPRGEVGLIFAGVGLGLMANGVKVVNEETYSAIVVMVILTTMVTPPLLKWSLNKPTPGAEPVEAA